eukprot:4378004-Lingulodinium_polyedra.AAC.1
MLRNDAVESTVQDCNGSQIARSRTPCAHQNWRAHRVHTRAICELLQSRTVDSTASLCNGV